MRHGFNITVADENVVSFPQLATKPRRSQIFCSESFLEPCVLTHRGYGYPLVARSSCRLRQHNIFNRLIDKQFQLRYCPSLAKKPVPKHADTTPKQKIDPFENPPLELHIVDIPRTDPSHFLVLNKFPIIAEHFILATKANKRQAHVLEQDDLEVTYACLKAWQDASARESKQKRLFAFFNSGDHSGASQPHRHLQFLPIERMHCGEATSTWDLLVDLIHRDGTQGEHPPTKSGLELNLYRFNLKVCSAPRSPILALRSNFRLGAFRYRAE